MFSILFVGWKNKKKNQRFQINVEVNNPIIMLNQSNSTLLDCHVQSIQNTNDINTNSKVGITFFIIHCMNIINILFYLICYVCHNTI